LYISNQATEKKQLRRDLCLCGHITRSSFVAEEAHL
jgi:hypothetical protein